MKLDVSLSEEWSNFVEAKVAAGQFGSSSDVVHAALQLMERFERSAAAQVEGLREAWQTGIDSGDAGELDFSELKQEARRRIARAKA